MKPEITFDCLKLPVGEAFGEASVPDLIGGLILQNRLEFYLGEEDEIFEGYGRRYNAYPYREFCCYTRQLKMGTVKTAILENQYLKAVFLPEYGGRLWSLWDKVQEKNLVYTNDVLRYSNLAVRNAWFSGGVEWNIGVIGHSPFTTAPLFTAVLEENGVPVLRMYEYERVRQVTYQMDFWLGKEDRFLNARMRILNSGEDVIPMYWWSNIAVPEYDNGRIVVPAQKAYTFLNGGVYKVDIPIVKGVDITRYKEIPVSVDYFFEIEREEPKYIANLNQEGYGLLHLSTNRLQSRKLFSWGKKRAGDHWQEFLTNQAGRYVEIQAGLGKTQYGCLPMAPHTAWEWLERYGAIQLDKEDTSVPFEELRTKVTGMVQEMTAFQELEQVLKDTKTMAHKKAEIKQYGSCFGALKNKIRALEGKRELSQHLDFGEVTGSVKLWADYLDKGTLGLPDPMSPPPDFICDEIFFTKLQKEAKTSLADHWYAQYQLGLLYFQKGRYEEALQALECSENTLENPWACHGIASVHTVCGRKAQAREAIRKGLRMMNTDLSYVKKGFGILNENEGYEEILQQYHNLSEDYQKEARILFYYSKALSELGRYQEAYDLLCQDNGLIMDDLREGEVLVGALWRKLHKELSGTEGELPYIYDFEAL